MKNRKIVLVPTMFITAIGFASNAFVLIAFPSLNASKEVAAAMTRPLRLN